MAHSAGKSAYGQGMLNKGSTANSKSVVKRKAKRGKMSYGSKGKNMSYKGKGKGMSHKGMSY